MSPDHDDDDWGPDEDDAEDLDGATAGPQGDPTDDAVARGVEALQVAAAEMISAARAMLDVAEELVQDPKAVGSVFGALSSVARSASRMAPPSGREAGRGRDDDDDDGGVRRIPVS